MDLILRRERQQRLSSLLSLRWIPWVRSNVTLEGSTIHKRHGVFTSTVDLDTATAMRVIGDSHGGVVLQVHGDHMARHFSLQLLRNDHLGFSAVSADALLALAAAVEVIDLRDRDNDWPQQVGARQGDRAHKPHRLSRASVQGRRSVAALFRSHADHVRSNGDLATSPLAGVRFTSKSIAAAMAEAYEPLMMAPVPPASEEVGADVAPSAHG